MACTERPDDFAERRKHLQALSDASLHERFWQLTDQIVRPLIEEARTHTTPSIERSVLLRLGFSSVEAGALVRMLHERGLLGRGAGRLVLELAKARACTVREAGLGLIDGRLWEALPQ